MKKKYKKKKIYRSHNTMGIIVMSLIVWGALTYLLIWPYTKASNTTITDTKDWTQITNNVEQSQTSQYAEKKIINMFTNIINESKERYETNFDFKSDASLQRYISQWLPLNDPNYIPPDLETIHTKYISSKLINPQLRAPARIAFKQMAKAFYEKFNKKLILKSAYRSFKSQKRLIDNGCSLKQCAKPGTSEHQLGLAVDLQVENKNWTVYKLNQINNKYYKRLDTHAHTFWFHNTYKKGLHTDSETKMKEFRHRRYCSIPVATFLYQNDLTLGEYVEINK